MIAPQHKNISKKFIVVIEAEKLGVTLLIENNVLAATNFSVFNEDPLLFTNPKEISSFMENMPKNVRLTVAILVTNTLGFDLIDAHVAD